jgi:putative glutamine amidotransferase
VDASRDRVELLLARKAAEDNLPLLAICRGVQVLNVAWGGTLYQDVPTQIPNALRHNFHPDHARNHLGHEVSIVAGTLLAELLGEARLGVNSFHHQAARDVAPGLRVSATSPDGVIEALEAPDKRFVLGVQWHPEELVGDDRRMKRLFDAFVSAAACGGHPGPDEA